MSDSSHAIRVGLMLMSKRFQSLVLRLVGKAPTYVILQR